MAYSNRADAQGLLMPLKTVDVNGATYAAIAEGKPIWVDTDGKETPFDIEHTRGTIGRLNGEAKSFREKMEAYEAKVRAYDGIEDPEAARKALDTIKNLETGDLVKAGKVEEIKLAARKAAEEQVAAAAKQNAEQLKSIEGERNKFRDDLYSEKIGGAFKGSKFISEKAAIPGDLMQARFGNNFKMEDGKVVAYDPSGNKIFSRAKPGDLADFDEALETLVDQYPYRDQILKGTGSSGSGSRGTGGNGQGSARTVGRAEFNKMSPMQQREIAMSKTAQIVD